MKAASPREIYHYSMVEQAVYFGGFCASDTTKWQVFFLVAMVIAAINIRIAWIELRKEE